MLRLYLTDMRKNWLNRFVFLLEKEFKQRGSFYLWNRKTFLHENLFELLSIRSSPYAFSNQTILAFFWRDSFRRYLFIQLKHFINQVLVKGSIETFWVSEYALLTLLDKSHPILLVYQLHQSLLICWGNICLEDVIREACFLDQARCRVLKALVKQEVSYESCYSV